MRLLEVKDNGDFSLTEFIGDNIPRYAILSHTWGADSEEVTYKDLAEGTGKNKAGYNKIRFCGERAACDSLQYFWVDTCCIDKTNNTELSEAINSMFRWYRNAAKCYVYLSDVSTRGYNMNDQISPSTWESAFRESKWFTRGWTLQELIAPVSVEFFSINRERLGDKKSLERQVHEITGIAIEALQGRPLFYFSVGERMLWAAKRETKREEDKAYSLLGIFDIHMPLIYGEGRENALIRLREELDKRSKDFQLDRLPNVSQAAFNSYEKQHESTCLENTRVEVLQEIRDWAHGRDDRPIFWLNGLAGTGKSTIARTVARENDENGCLGASFFFSRGGGDLAHAGKFFPTIAVQLSKRIPALKNLICTLVEKHNDIANHSLGDQWRHLILTPLTRLDNSFHQSRLLIVIDALDECEEDKDVRVLLRLLSEIKDITTVQFRIFITSRPETPLRLGFRQMPSIYHHDLVLEEISREVVDWDILTFFKMQFSEIREIFEEVAPDWPGEQRLNLLVNKSEGLFIYAATVCRFLKGNYYRSPDDLLSVLVPDIQGSESRKRKRSTPPKSPFSELDKMYTQILGYSLKHVEDLRDKAQIANEIRNIISAIAVVSQPLSPMVLGRLLDIEYTAIHRGLRPLRSLFNVPDDESSPIFPLHPSFRDFLFDRQRCTSQHFSITEQEVHKGMAEHCINLLSNILKHDICNVKRHGTLVSDVKISTIQDFLPPEVQYACIYWVQHVLKSGTKLSDDNWVHEFLNRNVLHWLEALSWIGRLTDGIHAITALELGLSNTEGPSLLKLVHDIKRFAQYSRSAIEQAPLQVYASALIFAPKRSVIREKFKNQIPRLIERLPETEEVWSAILQTLKGHSGCVNVVAFSPDGTVVASASDDKTVKLWDAQSGQERQTLRGHSDCVKAVAFSPDGAVVASASEDKTVRLWDAQSGQERQTLKGHSDWVNDVAFSPDGAVVASASDDETVKLWDTQSGQKRQTLLGYSGHVQAVAFSPDGTVVASTSWGNIVKLWDARSGQEWQILKGHWDCVNDVALSPDGTVVASASEDKTVKLWDARSGQERQTLKGHSDWVNAVAFSPNGTVVASASEDKTVKLWDARSGQERQTLRGHSDWVNDVAFSPDGTVVASASDDRTVKLWDTQSGQERQTLMGHSGHVKAVAFSSDGTVVASALDDKTVKLWDAQSGQERQTLRGHLDHVKAVAFSPDGTVVASASWDKTVKLWDAQSGQERQTLKGHSDWVNDVAFSPDGTVVASASDDETVKLWDARSGQERQKLIGHSEWVNTVAFSPDGTVVASASGDDTVKLWDARSGQERQTLKGHLDCVNDVAFSLDRTVMASASDDKTVKLWDAQSGQERQTLKGHSDWVNTVAFSPDGTIVASASDDKTVKLWDVGSGQERQTLQVYASIQELCFTSDGNYLLTERGVLDVISNASMSVQAQPALRPRLFVKEQWVTLGSENLLWLPPGYRASCVAIQGRTVVLGHPSGRVSMIEFLI